MYREIGTRGQISSLSNNLQISILEIGRRSSGARTVVSPLAAISTFLGMAFRDHLHLFHQPETFSAFFQLKVANPVMEVHTGCAAREKSGR
jgi:hypothetical protein